MSQHLISVEEAENLVLSHTWLPATEEVDLSEAHGRILAEQIVADRDFPPYNRVTMDGIAFQADAFNNGSRQFEIESIAPAGAPQGTLHNNQKCIEVMTGAILPDNTDTVIRYEDVTIEAGVAILEIDQLPERVNVHFKGEDRTVGDVIVVPGKKLGGPEIGVAATVGQTKIKVLSLPKVMIISTGDELVELDKKPLPHQIRKSNVYRLQSTLASWGLSSDRHHLIDEQNVIHRDLNRILNQYDLVILSGGVSKGKFDFIPEALDHLGVDKLFYKVAQRPGKPFWFGVYKEKTVVFALPGNPVSSFMCARRYLLPWLQMCYGQTEVHLPKASLTRDVIFKPDLTYYMQVNTRWDKTGNFLAEPVEGHGSGDLANLVDADGFLEIPRGKSEFKKGEQFPYLHYR